MKWICLYVLLFTGCLVATPVFLKAQKDTGTTKKGIVPGDHSADSLKDKILNEQSEQLQAIRAGRIGDSIRLVQLKQELEQIGAGNDSRKKELSAERDEIINRDSIRYLNLKKKIDSVRSMVDGFPVILDNDTLFFVYANLGSFSAKQRAEGVTERVKILAEDYFYKADSLKIVAADLSLDIVYKESVIKSVTDIDAIWEKTTQQDLAEKYLTSITAAISKYKKAHSWKTLAKDILLAVLVLAILSLLLYLVTRLFRGIKNNIEIQRGKKIRGVKFRNYEFLDANRQVYVLFGVLNIIQWILILTLVYLSLPVLLGIFPWTGGYAKQLISYFLNPLKHVLISVWEYLPNLLTIVILVIVFRYTLRLLSFFKTEIEKGRLKIPGFYIDWANPTFQIIRLLVLAFMLIVIFPYLPGSDSPIFKGVSVFLGVLFTFGSAGALSNLIAGLVLTYMRSYRIGDRVQIGQVTGDVVEKSLLVTRIKTIKNEIVSIPNSTVMGSHTTNYSADALDHGLILHTGVTIGYDAPWRKVHDLLIKAALATDLIEKEPVPFVFQEKLDDFYVHYQINAYTHSPNRQHITYSLLHQNIQDAFNEAGVEIMSSHYSNIRDGNQTTVPAENLPKDYVAPSFRVKNTGKENKD